MSGPLLNTFCTGHCRRRKIRCLLAPDDAQNRCANCIRLKKDCNFFPVDQQPQFDRRPRASSKADTRGSTSSESSPALVSGHLPEEYHTYPQLPLSYLSSRGSVAAVAGDLVSPMTRGKIYFVSKALCTSATNDLTQLPSLRKDLNSHSIVGLLGALHFRMSQQQEGIRHQGMPPTSIGGDMQNRR